MIIDSHCHLDYEPLNSNIKSVIKRAEDVGVKYFLTICTTDVSFLKILKILKENKNVFGTYGIHPHEASNFSNLSTENIINNISKDNKIIGIGETGLDFYYEHSDRKIQKQLFLRHIHACQESSKTLIVHSRSAENETYDILSSEYKNKKFKILMHCYTGSKIFAHKLLDIECYFSASGIVTFKNSKDLSETFKSIPKNRILIETDSPYLSPEPLRGKTNEPSHLIHTLKYMSKIRNEIEENFSFQTSENFINLFDLKI